MIYGLRCTGMTACSVSPPVVGIFFLKFLSSTLNPNANNPRISLKAVLVLLPSQFFPDVKVPLLFFSTKYFEDPWQIVLAAFIQLPIYKSRRDKMKHSQPFSGLAFPSPLQTAPIATTCLKCWINDSHRKQQIIIFWNFCCFSSWELLYTYN